jgi:hypothetical protein
MAQQRYQVFHEPAGAAPVRWVHDSAAGDDASLAAARAAADRARTSGGACTLLADGRAAQTWNDPLKPAPPQPAGWLVNAGSYRRDARHELHAQARVLGRRSQSDASDKLDLDIASSETGVSRRQCSVQIVDGACRAAGLSAAQASGILRRDGARDILRANETKDLCEGDILILDPLNAPYRPGAPLSPVLPAAVRFAYRVVVAPPSAVPPQSFFGKVAATVRSWTGRGNAPEATPSIKEMKAAIVAAGLSVADLVEKADVVERYRQALAKERPEAPASATKPKRKRRTIAESDDEDDGAGAPAAPATPAAAPAPAPADEEELPDAPPPEASDDEGAPMDTTDEAPRFQIGDTVEVAARTFPGINKSGGPGTVTKVNDERNEDGGPMRDGSSSRTTGFTYAVKYTMGGSEKRVDAQWITKSTDEDEDGDAFAVGDRIEARWGKGTTWYPGAVTKVRPPKTRGRSSTFDVLYDDGEAEESVQPEDMRPPRSSSLRPSPKRVKTPAAAKKRPVTTTEDRVPRDTRKRWPAKVANIVDDLVVDGADLPRVLDLFRDRCLIRGEVPLDRTLKGLLRALAKAADPRAADLLRACLSLSVEEDLDSASLDEDALLERLENDLGFDAAEKRDALLDRLASNDAAAAEALGAAPNAAGAGRRTAALARGAGVAAPKGDGPLDVLVRGILST